MAHSGGAGEVDRDELRDAALGHRHAKEAIDPRHRDAVMRDHEETARHVSGVRALAQQAGREIDVYTVGVVTCRPTAREAQDYYRHAVIDNADWMAVDNILRMKNITRQTHSPEEFHRIRNHQANGMGGLPLVGDPDAVAQDITRLAALGLNGIAVSFVNYLDELPYFRDEVLPRLARAGVREAH